MRNWLHNFLSAGSVLLLLIHLYYMDHYRPWFTGLTGYVRLATGPSFFNSLVGIINFMFPFCINEAVTLLLVTAFYRNREFSLKYLKFSAIYLFLTLIIRTAGHLFDSVSFINFARSFYAFGLGPTWPLFILAFFYLLQAKRHA